MHQEMKRMFMMVALFTNGVKAGDELSFREQGTVRFGGGNGHNSNSIPS